MIYQVLLEVKYGAQINHPQEYVFTSHTLITRTPQNKAPHDILAKIKHRNMYVI